MRRAGHPEPASSTGHRRARRPDRHPARSPQRASRGHRQHRQRARRRVAAPLATCAREGAHRDLQKAMRNVTGGVRIDTNYMPVCPGILVNPTDTSCIPGAPSRSSPRFMKCAWYAEDGAVRGLRFAVSSPANRTESGKVRSGQSARRLGTTDRSKLTGKPTPCGDMGWDGAIRRATAQR